MAYRAEQNRTINNSQAPNTDEAFSFQSRIYEVVVARTYHLVKILHFVATLRGNHTNKPIVEWPWN